MSIFSVRTDVLINKIKIIQFIKNERNLLKHFAVKIPVVDILMFFFYRAKATAGKGLPPLFLDLSVLRQYVFNFNKLYLCIFINIFSNQFRHVIKPARS